MNIETVDKCLNFASGDKNHQVATGIRNKEFPENLLRGNAKERELRRYKESGVPLNELKRWQGQSTTSGYRYIIDTMQLYSASFKTVNRSVAAIDDMAYREGIIEGKRALNAQYLENGEADA